MRSATTTVTIACIMPNAPTTIRSSRPTFRDGCLDNAAVEFGRVRPRLLGIAYRILGSWTEAEDIVQDAWLRWQTYDRSLVLNSTAFLVTTTTRLAINAAQSARARHESYVGRWLTEPVDAGDDPALGAERSEALALGILLLLQRLSPTERGAYVLRHAFDYPYPQIADMLQTTEANARQLVSRASKHIAAERRQSASRADQQRLMHAFVAAAQRGDVTALEDLFAADVVSLPDAQMDGGQRPNGSDAHQPRPHGRHSDRRRLDARHRPDHVIRPPRQAVGPHPRRRAQTSGRPTADERSQNATVLGP